MFGTDKTSKEELVAEVLSGNVFDDYCSRECLPPDQKLLRIIDPPKYRIGETVCLYRRADVKGKVVSRERQGNGIMYLLKLEGIDGGTDLYPEFMLATLAELVADKLRGVVDEEVYRVSPLGLPHTVNRKKKTCSPHYRY
jgi:hypothetical protein